MGIGRGEYCHGCNEQLTVLDDETGYCDKCRKIIMNVFNRIIGK